MVELTLETLNNVVKFGKYKNLTWEQVLYKDTDYIIWCDINIEWFKLDMDVFDLIFYPEKLEEYKIEQAMKVKECEGKNTTMVKLANPNAYPDDYYDTDYPTEPPF